MKKQSLLSIVAMLVVSASAFASSQPAVSIANISALPTQTVQVPIVLATQGVRLATVRMDIKYDPLLVSNPLVTIGPAGVGKTVSTNTLSSGALRVSLFDVQNTPLSDGTIINIAFTVTSSVTSGSTINLIFDSGTLGACDLETNDVVITSENGVISVN